MYAVGIIHLALLERYQEEVSKTAWTGALQSALISVGGLLKYLNILSVYSELQVVESIEIIMLRINTTVGDLISRYTIHMITIIDENT